MCSAEVLFFHIFFFFSVGRFLSHSSAFWFVLLVMNFPVVLGLSGHSDGLPTVLLFQFFFPQVTLNRTELTFSTVWARTKFLLRWVGNEDTPLIKPTPFSWEIKMPPEASSWLWIPLRSSLPASLSAHQKAWPLGPTGKTDHTSIPRQFAECRVFYLVPRNHVTFHDFWFQSPTSNQNRC